MFPRFVSPPVFALLWAVCGILFVAGAVAWFARVPEYASGHAALVRPADADGGEGLVLVAFLPPRSLSSLRPGQTVFVRRDGADLPDTLSIETVSPAVLSPAAVRSRYGAEIAAAAEVTGPTAVAVARFESPGALAPAVYEGSVYRVDVETGARPLVSFFPRPGAGRTGS